MIILCKASLQSLTYFLSLHTFHNLCRPVVIEIFLPVFFVCLSFLRPFCVYSFPTPKRELLERPTPKYQCPISDTRESLECFQSIARTPRAQPQEYSQRIPGVPNLTVVSENFWSSRRAPKRILGVPNPKSIPRETLECATPRVAPETPRESLNSARVHAETRWSAQHCPTPEYNPRFLVGNLYFLSVLTGNPVLPPFLNRKLPFLDFLSENLFLICMFIEKSLFPLCFTRTQIQNIQGCL